MYAARLNIQSSVAVHLSQAYAEQLKRDNEEKQQNREALMAIVDIIRFLARQNISFRGHREGNESVNCGNFLAMVQFTSKYNPALSRWLECRPENVSWMSPEIQNELLHLIAAEVTMSVANECRGKLYSIMCDEVSDYSNCELLSIVVRYVVVDDSAVHVRESLIGLVRLCETKAAIICDAILKKLNDLNLPLEFLVAQCFDGASNMSGCYSGVQARLKDVCPRRPMYVHCWAHVLNLVIQDVVKSVPLCSRTFDLLHKAYVLIAGSPKRHAEYLACVADMKLGDGLQVLQSLCATRWAARSVNLRIVERCLPAILSYLSSQSDADSQGLLVAFKQFDFVFGLLFLKELFLSANTASEALQASDIDLSAAAAAIENLKVFVKNLRTDSEYSRVYSATENRCSNLGIDCTKQGAKKRKITLPASLKGTVMTSFVTRSSDAVGSQPSEMNEVHAEGRFLFTCVGFGVCFA